MSGSSIPVGSTGKSLQTFENDLGAGPVHAEAVTLVNQSGLPIATSAAGTLYASAPNREVVTDLSFVQTLSAFGVYTTGWVDISAVHWLEFLVEMQTNGAVTGLFELTNAPDPNVTAPGANDIVRPLQQTLAGTGLGAPSNILRFGDTAQMKWCRITVTDLTGGQTIKAAVYAQQISPSGAILPLAAVVTPDFTAPLTQSTIRAFDPSNVFRSQRFSGVVAGQSSTTTLPAGTDFTGSAWVDTTGFVGLAVFLKSDAVAASLKLQLSFDAGATVHYEDPRAYDAAPDGSIFKFSISTPGVFVRVKLTAGVSNMTNLVLKTYLLAHETEDVSVRVGEAITPDMVADVVKAQLVALKDDGTGVNVTATDSGNIRHSVSEHEVATPIKALNGGGQTRQVTVGTAAVQLDNPALPNRVGLSIKADEDNTNSVWYGYSSAVTTATGFRLSPGEPKEWDHGTAAEIWAISDAVDQKVYVDQVADVT